MYRHTARAQHGAMVRLFAILVWVRGVNLIPFFGAVRPHAPLYDTRCRPDNIARAPPLDPGVTVRSPRIPSVLQKMAARQRFSGLIGMKNSTSIQSSYTKQGRGNVSGGRAIRAHIPCSGCEPWRRCSVRYPSRHGVSARECKYLKSNSKIYLTIC